MKRTRKVTRGFILRQVLFGLGLTLLTAFILVFSFPNDFDLVAGDVAPRDIRSPMDFSYISDILTAQAQDEAVRQVAPVYTTPDFAIAREQYDRARQVLTYLRELRADLYASEPQRNA